MRQARRITGCSRRKLAHERGALRNGRPSRNRPPFSVDVRNRPPGGIKQDNASTRTAVPSSGEPPGRSCRANASVADDRHHRTTTPPSCHTSDIRRSVGVPDRSSTGEEDDSSNSSRHTVLNKATSPPSPPRTYRRRVTTDYIGKIAATIGGGNVVDINQTEPTADPQADHSWENRQQLLDLLALGDITPPPASFSDTGGDV